MGGITSPNMAVFVVENETGGNKAYCTMNEGIGKVLRFGAYDEEVVDAEKNDTRVVLHLHPALAPIKAAVLPLSKKLTEKAEEVYTELAKEFRVEFDETGSIGKRYRRQDEIGTPFCITYDFESETDGCVTVRDRDSMEQERVAIADLKAYLAEKLAF